MFIYSAQAIIVCLESQDYVQIRNSLIILIRILPHFPVLTKLSQCIEKKIEKIKEEEKNKRQDLFVLATSYSGQLKARASSIMRESDFHLVSLHLPYTVERGWGGDKSYSLYYVLEALYSLKYQNTFNVKSTLRSRQV